MPDNQRADGSSLEKTLKIAKESPYEDVFIWPEALRKFKDVNDTVICSERFADVWRSEKFLRGNVSNGLEALLRLKGGV